MRKEGVLSDNLPRGIAATVFTALGGIDNMHIWTRSHAGRALYDCFWKKMKEVENKFKERRFKRSSADDGAVQEEVRREREGRKR